MIGLGMPVTHAEPVVIDSAVHKAAIRRFDLPQIIKLCRLAELDKVLFSQRRRISRLENSYPQLGNRVDVTWSPQEKMGSFSLEQFRIQRGEYRGSTIKQNTFHRGNHMDSLQQRPVRAMRFVDARPT
jgi:hypothetical protein